MLATLCYDVEDLITPESDDAAKWIAASLTEAGIVATLFLVGEKVRLYRQRGREDVIEALKAHELGFHSTWHSVHPTVCEVCEDRSFLDGILALMERERDGWQEAEAILGTRLIGWATTGGSWTPSLCGLMHQWGGVQVYSPACFGEHSVVWYGNCLNFGQLIGGLDTIYASADTYQDGMKRLERQIEEALNSTRDWLGVFGGHPTRVIAHEFWDGVNFADGANPPRSEWRRPRLRVAEEILTAQRHFGDFARRLRADGRLDFRPLGDVSRLFRGQARGCSGESLREIAERVSQEARPIFTESFTAAEIVVLLAHGASLGELEGAWFVRPTVFGPNQMPPDLPPTRLSTAAIRVLAPEITGSVAETGCLPSVVKVGETRVSLGQALVGLARLLCHPERDAIEIPAVRPHPSLGDEIAERARRGIRGWSVHPSGLDTERIEDAARLQAWTLKPAWHRDRLPWEAHPHHGGHE